MNHLNEMRDMIRSALLQEWDPIGVKTIPEASDEYDSYAGTICQILMERCSEEEIFHYLWKLETEHMGLRGDEEATKSFVNTLIQIRDNIYCRLNLSG